ncbi:DnaB-like helicase C-terminal domain-containing protein, partial [Staphylococcus aureus]
YLKRMEPRMGTPEHAEWMAKNEAVHGIAELIVAKHRNGPIGKVELQFQGELTRFSDYVKPDHLPEQYY